MGLLFALNITACRRRRPAAPQTVCPISGQTNKSGVCPVSKQSTIAVPAKQPAAKKQLAMPSAEDVKRAAELKEIGNEHFKKQNFEEALAVYLQAVQLNRMNPAIWLNLSITSRQLENWEDAEAEAEVAQELDPTNAKVYYSRALALQQLGQLEKSLSVCKAGLKQQTQSKPLSQLKTAVENALAAQKQDKVVAVQQLQGSQPNVNETQSEVEQENIQQLDDACPVTKLKENDLQDIREQAEKVVYEWQGENPSNQEREGYKKILVNAFKGKYQELKAQSAAHKSKRTTLQTDQYDKEQKLNLKLQGGHQPMERPEHVDLPAAYKEYLGVITVEQLSAFNCDNEDRRYLLSVYGNVFDVSDRPDKYGPDGPYIDLTGKDLTWGLFTGADQPEFCNKFYDLFKAKDKGCDKLAGLCSWWAWYETEYGEPVARLEPFTHERDLPAPPQDELGEACILM